MRDAIAGLWTEVDDFLASTALAGALDENGGVTVEEFAGVMELWVTTRSDTFRIRAYGEAANRGDPTRLESEARCEAIVERTGGALPGFGRRFVVTAFRWLGPDDI